MHSFSAMSSSTASLLLLLATSALAVPLNITLPADLKPRFEGISACKPNVPVYALGVEGTCMAGSMPGDTENGGGGSGSTGCSSQATVMDNNCQSVSITTKYNEVELCGDTDWTDGFSVGCALSGGGGYSPALDGKFQPGENYPIGVTDSTGTFYECVVNQTPDCTTTLGAGNYAYAYYCCYSNDEDLIGAGPMPYE